MSVIRASVDRGRDPETRTRLRRERRQKRAKRGSVVTQVQECSRTSTQESTRQIRPTRFSNGVTGLILYHIIQAANPCFCKSVMRFTSVYLDYRKRHFHQVSSSQSLKHHTAKYTYENIGVEGVCIVTSEGRNRAASREVDIRSESM